MKTQLLTLLLLSVSSVQAVIHGGKYTIKGDPAARDGGLWAELGTFGYGRNGRCVVQMKTTLEDELDQLPLANRTAGIGFLVAKRETLGTPLSVDVSGLCKAGQNFEGFKRVTMNLDAALTEQANKDNKDKPRIVIYTGEVHFTNDPGFWELFMYECQSKDAGENNYDRFHLEIQVSEFNQDGGIRNYLQVGDMPLPLAFMIFALIFFGLLIKWGQWMSANKEHLHTIHFLMALALFLKSGTLFFESFRYKHYEDAGNMSSFYDYMYYTFLAMKGTLLFAVIALIGSGWAYLKPYLHPRDKKILMVVIPLQLFINILWIVIDHWRDGDKTWKFWQDVLSGLDMACCLIVMVPILWSVKQIRNAQNSDGKVAKNLQRMKQFRTLYLAIVIYIYFKTIICGMVLTDQVSYENTWIPPVLTELATLVCFIFVGMKFRPMKENPYTHLDEEDMQEGGEALEQELADLENQNRRDPEMDLANQPHEGAMGSTEQRRGAHPPSASSGGLSAVKKQPEADF